MCSSADQLVSCIFLPWSIYFHIFFMSVIWWWISRRLLSWKSRCVLLKEGSIIAVLDIFPLSSLWTQVFLAQPERFWRASSGIQTTHPSFQHPFTRTPTYVCSAYIPQIIHLFFSCNLRLFLQQQRVFLCWEPTVTCVDSGLFCYSCSLGACYRKPLQLGTKGAFC